MISKFNPFISTLNKFIEIKGKYKISQKLSKNIFLQFLFKVLADYLKNVLKNSLIFLTSRAGLLTELII
jgi:hypothetical protein